MRVIEGVGRAGVSVCVCVCVCVLIIGNILHRASLKSAKTTANGIYCPPKLQVTYLVHMYITTHLL